jgi:YVTN family beta-propeller protein
MIMTRFLSLTALIFAALLIAAFSSPSSPSDGLLLVANTGYGTASTPDGKSLLVALPDANAVAVINLPTLQVVKTIVCPRLLKRC